MQKEQFDTPSEAVSMILKKQDIYAIKVKCAMCHETPFMPYEKVCIEGEIFRVNSCSYPLSLIEKIAVRYRECWFDSYTVKSEYQCFISPLYLRQWLNPEAERQLKQFGL